jgi:hypothetical protein
MAGHSRPKDGVAPLAYVPAIHALLHSQGVDARDKRGHDDGWFSAGGVAAKILAVMMHGRVVATTRIAAQLGIALHLMLAQK